jgi:hypothetical protein
MRKIETHKVNPANDVLDIMVMDAPGSGGACHRYDITGFDTANNPAAADEHGYRASFSRLPVVFQNGPIGEAGANGVTHEALLAILIDRLEHFQAGPFANDYNAAALAHLQSAQGCLLDRTRERMARGVEGTQQP